MNRNKKKIYREGMMGTHFTRKEKDQMIKLIEITCVIVAFLCFVAIMIV